MRLPCFIKRNLCSQCANTCSQGLNIHSRRLNRHSHAADRVYSSFTSATPTRSSFKTIRRSLAVVPLNE